MKKFFALVISVAAIAFAAETASVPAPTDPTVDTSVEQVPVDVMQEELSLRDSLCMVEKDSLRKAVVVEEAKSANWEKSYQTMKADNEVCAKALGVALGVNEKSKENADEEKKKAAMMGGTSFLSGLGIGLLIMWLIMK